MTRRTSRVHRSPGGALGASFLVALVCLGLSGCKRDGSSLGHAPSSRSNAPPPPPNETSLRELETRAAAWLDRASALPARAEVVALADELAIAAARMEPGSRAPRFARLAADLRTRIWRVGHAEADAREAIELYAAASKGARAAGSAEDACQSAAERAIVTGELARSPAVLYREMYACSKLFEGAPCDARFANVLTTIEAFRPAKEELAAIDADVQKQKSESAKQALPAGPTVSTDESGVVLVPTQGATGSKVKVAGIQPYGSKDRARIVITLSGPASYRVGELAGPRLFLDLERTEPSRQRDIPVGGLVQRVRQSAHQEGDSTATRVVLDLSTQAYRRIFYLPEPFRIVVDVANRPPNDAAKSPGENVKFSPGTPRGVSRIALDAGHGGPDPGAIGPSGLREKDVTLAIAHLAAPVLSRELGILTLLTRDDDRLVPLDERAARANAFHADLFVSIHCNAADSGAAHGVMSFVLDPSRDEAAARIAARENATSLAASSQVASIASGLRHADTQARSTRFAELLQRSTMASLAGRFGDASDQGVKTAGFFVLLGAEMPSVLLETSFISNPAEEKRLATAEYRQKLADGIVNAVRAYREGR